jgi:hypothetical protein
MPTDEAKEIYKQRAPTPERPNAEFQERLGLRSFAVRGLARVRCVALWTALAYNVIHFAEILVGSQTGSLSESLVESLVT